MCYIARVKSTQQVALLFDTPNAEWLHSFGNGASVRDIIENDLNLIEGSWKQRNGRLGTGCVTGKRKLVEYIITV